MSDLRSQIRAHYEAHSLPPEKVDAILARGRGADADELPELEKKTVSFPTQRWMRTIMALAAALVLCAGLAMSWWMKAPARAEFAALVPRVVTFLENKPALEHAPQDKSELRAWLVAQGAPPEMEIPPALQSLESFACQVIDVQGRKTWLACFWREQRPDRGGHELVHLIVARRQDFHAAPDSAAPQMRELNGWSFASWTKGEIVYTLAAAAPPEKLRPFLTLRAAPGYYLFGSNQ